MADQHVEGVDLARRLAAIEPLRTLPVALDRSAVAVVRIVVPVVGAAAVQVGRHQAVMGDPVACRKTRRPPPPRPERSPTAHIRGDFQSSSTATAAKIDAAGNSLLAANAANSPAMMKYRQPALAVEPDAHGGISGRYRTDGRRQMVVDRYGEGGQERAEGRGRHHEDSPPVGRAEPLGQPAQQHEADHQRHDVEQHQHDTGRSRKGACPAWRR